MILDTCAVLWLAAGSKKLRSTVLKQINQAPVVYVSAISGFEISIKVAKRKLQLPSPPKKWLEEVVTHHSLTILPLELDVCVAGAELPPIHDDPCDRFIIAAAKLHNLPVVTDDRNFEKYGIDVIN